MPTTTAPTFVRAEFVPASIDATRWEEIDPLVNQLLAREVRTPGEFERWLIDRSELEAACSEARANLYIDMTCATDDPKKAKAYSDYIEAVPPRLTPATFELDKRQASMMEKVSLDPARYGVLARATKANVELFRPENVPIETQVSLLEQKYEALNGAMTVQYDGREQTLPQMARYQELTDRAAREGAWRAVAQRRLADEAALDRLFDDLVRLRDQIARNAGFDNFVGYAFKSKHRFDYGVKECLEFHRGIEVGVVPFMRNLDKKRAARLRVSPLRPWDLSVDEKGRPPLRPFEGGAQLMGKSVSAFDRLDPRLGSMLRTLGEAADQASKGPPSLDLDSRKGKAPGGYQYMRDRVRRPFIFMNAAGLQRDVSTMLHEAGHAFHSLLCVQEPLLWYRHSPIEFAEVASMTMELLALPYLKRSQSVPQADAFYENEEDWARHVRHQLEKSVTILPWIATVDAFQHWVYANPGHTHEQRKTAWLALDDRFGNAVSWEGLEATRGSLWHRQLHIFTHPFYYVEYGIAQLGALGLWLHALEKGEKSAVEAYMRGLSLGGSKPLPELFATAGLKFEFGPDSVKRITDRVAKELEKLPE
jgi:oligoendopeptidase F